MLAAVFFDDEIAEKFAGSFGELGDMGHVVGGPAVIGASVGALLVATRFTENDRFRAFTYTTAQALILDDVLFFSIKFAVDRKRPNAENHNHYYGKGVGIPSYIVATLIAVSRLEKNKHYLSDVVFGAVLGYKAARTV